MSLQKNYHDQENYHYHRDRLSASEVLYRDAILHYHRDRLAASEVLYRDAILPFRLTGLLRLRS